MKKEQLMSKKKIATLSTSTKTAKLGDYVLLGDDVCIVTKAGVKGQLVFFSEELNKLRAYSNINVRDRKLSVFLLSAESMTEKVHSELAAYYKKEFKKLIKGAYVSFMDKEVKRYGIVEKGGNKPVVISREKGMEYEIKAHASVFKEETPPEIEIPVQLKEWNFASFKENTRMSEETISFNVIVKNGKTKIFDASNRGNGGCMNSYNYESKKSQQMRYQDFVEAVNESLVELFPDNEDRPNLSEMDEQYILWYNISRKKYVTWKDYASRFVFD